MRRQSKRRRMAARFGVITTHIQWWPDGRCFVWTEGDSTWQRALARRPLDQDVWVNLGYTTDAGWLE